jgi:hypothetical protein
MAPLSTRGARPNTAFRGRRTSMISPFEALQPGAPEAFPLGGPRTSHQVRMSEGAEVIIRHFPTELGGRKHAIRPRPDDSVHYLPHFRVGADGEELGVRFVGGDREIAPGTEGRAMVVFLYDMDYSPLGPGVDFDVLEGPHLVATGTVLRRGSSEALGSDLLPA